MTRHGRSIRPLTGVLLAATVTACSSRGHAQTTLPQADSLAQSGEYEAAITAYRRVVARDGAWEAVLGLARTYQAVGRYDEAVTALESAIADSVPGSHQLWNSLGGEFLRLGKDSAAQAAFERAIATDARDRLSARLNLAVLSFERGRVDDAMRQFDAFIDVYNRGGAKTAADLAAVADAVRYLGRTNPQLYKDALLAYDEAIRADPDNLDIQTRLGSLFLEKYVGDEATTTFSGVLERNPNHAGALLGLARVQHFDGSSEAFQQVQKSLSINPNLAEARAFLARLYLDLEDYEAAAGQAEQVLAVNPRNGEALAMLAAARFLADNPAGFATARDSALGINPTDAGFFITLSEISARNRLYQRAVDFADRAVELDSLAWRAHALRGLNRLRTGAIPQGRADLETAFAGDPYDLWTKNTLDLLDVVERYTEVGSPRFTFVLDPKEAGLIRLYLEPLAEEAYDRLAARYGIQVPAPIRVEVYPRHADFSVRTIGLAGLGALGVSFGPVIAMDAPSARPPGGFHWGATFWHELAHTFHMAASGYRVPRWFTEGLAVFEERRARPGWGDDVTPGFLIAYRQGRLAPVSNLNQGFMRPAYPQQVIHSYYQSSLVFELIEQDYGFEAIRRMLEAYRDGADTPSIFRSVLDIEPEALDSKFNAYLETRFAGALASLSHAEAREGDGARPRTRDLARRAQSDTTDFVAQLGLGRALFAEGNLDEALPPLLRAKALFPEYLGNDSPRWLLGQIYRSQGQLDRAAAELADLTTRNAKHYPALLALAEIEATRGNLEPAARALESLMYVYPYAMEHHGRLAGLSTRLGNHETALRERHAVVALEPVDRPQALYELARAYQRVGNLDAARRTVLRALEEAPNYQDALDLLVELRTARGSGAS
ncbi:MAG: tetratricopeptide repeat protein [Gemmatimonadales bacterium]|nr:tetratricopeptide repeat protein [Gemmatimonadales bacterium]